MQFGSSVYEVNKNVEHNPNDIDIAVFFEKISLKEQLNKAQSIKKELQKQTKLPIHIKAFDYYSFFNEGNFAKENILFYGISIITKKYFAERFGLKPYLLINYSLKGLPKKDKVKLNYWLKGKKNYSGFLESKGRLISPGTILVEPKYEKIIIYLIKKITSNFYINKILINQNE